MSCPTYGPLVLTPEEYQQVKTYRLSDNHTRMSWKRMARLLDVEKNLEWIKKRKFFIREADGLQLKL